MNRLRISMLLLIPVAFVVAGAGVSAQARPASATVTVLHALPGFTADVYVNDELTLSGFEPQTATDPIELPAGRYVIEIRDVGASPTSRPALEGTVRLEAGQNLSIIAGLTPTEEPELNVFTNTVTRVPSGRTRLIVRNVAAVSSIGIRLDGERLFARVQHGGQQMSPLDAGGPYPLEATVSGEAAIGPEDLVLEEGTVGIVYAVGSREQDNLGFMFQTIQGLQTSPGSILTGNGGSAETPGSPRTPFVVAVLAILGVGAALVVRRTDGAPRPVGRV